MKRLSFFIVTLWGVLGLQVSINHFVGGTWFTADILLIATIFFGLARGPVTGQVMGFFWGLLIDASSMGLLGMHTLLYAIAGYTAGMIRRQLDESKPWTQSLFTLGMSTVFSLSYSLLLRVLAPDSRLLSWPLVTLPVVGAVLAPVVFWALYRWSEFWSLPSGER